MLEEITRVPDNERCAEKVYLEHLKQKKEYVQSLENAARGETGLHDKSSDKEVLQRLHDRLINEFAIDWHYDYMHKLRAIISRMES